MRMQNFTAFFAMAMAMGVTAGAVAQTVRYQVPECAYYGSVAGASGGVPHYPVEIVVPPYCDLLFTDVSTGVTGVPEWSVNNSEAYPQDDPNYGLPMGEATLLPADRDGNYVYHIGGPGTGDVEGEGYYRFPILTYDAGSYNLSQVNNQAGATRQYYTRYGIRATNEMTTLTLSNIGMAGNFHDGFTSLFWGGINNEVVYPQVAANFGAGENTLVTNVLDGDESTYFTPFGPALADDFILIDCGEVAERSNIDIVFADDFHTLRGSAVVLVGENDNPNEMTVVGNYTEDQVDGNVYQCRVNGERVNNVSGRYIAFYVTGVTLETYETGEVGEDGSPVVAPIKPYYAEIVCDDIRTFSAPRTETVNYPTFTSGAQGNVTNPAFPETNMFDGDLETYWTENLDQWQGDFVRVDCGESVPRNTLSLTYPSDGVYYPVSSVLEISDDDSNWTQVGDAISGDEVVANNYVVSRDAGGATARYIRARIITRNSGCYWRIAEFGIDGYREFSETYEVETTHPMMPEFTTFYPRPADPFYLDHISMYATTIRTSGTNQILPVGQEIKVAVIKVDRNENNSKVLGDTIAKATITTSDFMNCWETTAGLYYQCMQVNFYDMPDGIGVPQRKKVLIDSEFVVKVYDLDKVPGLNISFTFTNGYINRSDLAGYVTTDGVTNWGNYNFLWQLHGNYVTMRPAVAPDGIIQCPADGGVALENAVFYTSVAPTDIDIQAPDWVTLEFGEMPADDIATTITITADTNDSGAARSGEIVLTSPEGVVCTYAVAQDYVEVSGIDSFITKAISVTRAGNDLLVTYPESISHVSIYNATGTLMASYRLPDGGSFTVPAANLGSGMYIVKLWGDNVVKTVKVVK